MLETGYYQNASRVGETNIAAYPQARVDYGVAQNVEVFYDVPNEIAESVRSVPSYTMTGGGFGMSYETIPSHGLQYSLSGQISPPSAALSNPQLLPDASVNAAAAWSGSDALHYGIYVGTFAFSQHGRHGRHSSPETGLFATQALDAKTLLTSALNVQSRSFLGASAQTSGMVGVQRTLSEALMFNVNVGNTFNAAARSKPHYLGFGLTVR